MAERRRDSARILLSAASLVVLIAGLKAASTILVPFMVALFVSFVSLPLLFWLQRRRLPAVLCVALTILADVALLAGAGFLVSTSMNDLAREFPGYVQRLRNIGDHGVDWLEERGVPAKRWLQVEETPEVRLPSDVRGIEVVGEPDGTLEPFEEVAAQAWWFNLFDLDSVVDLTNRALRGVAAALSNAVIVVLITTFILAEVAGFREKIRLAFGSVQLADRLTDVTEDMRRYLAIKTAVSAVTGVLLGTWVGILGVDFALLWGLVAFGLNFIPNLGSIIAALPPMLLALVQHGPGSMLLVGVGYLVVNLALGNVVEPALMGRRLGLSTLVVFLSLVFWGWVWGPVGMLLSVPITMTAKILLENSDQYRWIAVLLGDASGSPRRRKRRPDGPRPTSEREPTTGRVPMSEPEPTAPES
ncbi:MAG TPA: AI-2E family transporter [Thermoanaerobaculia bacterium]|nr:AI-2E family transporter [Thermoanaerobaculia bacterium]